MKKQIYRIELTTTDTIFTDIIFMAALSNGGEFIPLSKIADTADWLCKKYPATGSMHTVNRIGENHLTIDYGITNIINLTLITVMDLTEELCPTLSRYDADSIIKEIEQKNPDQN